MKIVVINGYSCSGKDEFVKIIYFLRSSNNNLNHGIENYSTMKPILNMYRNIGISGRDEKFRKLISKTKEALIEYNDFSINELKRECDQNKRGIDLMFVHCREPEEIKKIVNSFNDVVTLFIHRDVEKLQIEIDKNIEDYTYDYKIINNGTKGQLLDQASRFLEWLDYDKNVPL